MEAVIRAAFPTSLQDDITALLRRVTFTSSHRALNEIAVTLSGESLRIPYRIYGDRSVLNGELTAREVLLLHCLFSRHHDGVERERCLRNIILSPEPWVIPFVVQLVSEYVVEIVEVVQANLRRLPSENYRAFLRANPTFFRRTRARVTSYWACYYREQFKDPKRYPGFAVLDFFDGLLAS